jgi:predicted MPP superfamily phosphohydrolase
MLKENEIVVQAHSVKYHDINYTDDYVVVTQHRTKRRIYNGFHFEDTGSHIYISTYCSGIFQHKYKVRNFVVNTVTKEWRNFETTILIRHKPDKIEKVESNEIENLKK